MSHSRLPVLCSTHAQSTLAIYRSTSARKTINADAPSPVWIAIGSRAPCRRPIDVACSGATSSALSFIR